METETVDGSTFIFKKINHLPGNKTSTVSNLKCFLLGQVLNSNYWIVINNSDPEMKPVFIGFEAYETLGRKICAERIHDLYSEFKESFARIQRSPFYQG